MPGYLLWVRVFFQPSRTPGRWFDGELVEEELPVVVLFCRETGTVRVLFFMSIPLFCL